jgi:hypothetical protein
MTTRYKTVRAFLLFNSAASAVVIASIVIYMLMNASGHSGINPFLAYWYFIPLELISVGSTCRLAAKKWGDKARGGDIAGPMATTSNAVPALFRGQAAGDAY